MNDMIPIEQSMIFDYGQLDEETSVFVLEQEQEMERVLKRTAFELGTILLRVKSRLPHGMYEKWYRSKGITKNMAWRMTQIAQGKEVKGSKIELLPQISAPLFSREIVADTFYMGHGAHQHDVYVVGKENGWREVDESYATICIEMWAKCDQIEYAQRERVTMSSERCGKNWNG